MRKLFTEAERVVLESFGGRVTGPAGHFKPRSDKKRYRDHAYLKALTDEITRVDDLLDHVGADLDYEQYEEIEDWSRGAGKRYDLMPAQEAKRTTAKIRNNVRKIEAILSDGLHLVWKFGYHPDGRPR